MPPDRWPELVRKVMFQKVPRALVKGRGSAGARALWLCTPPQAPGGLALGRPGLLRLCGEGTVTYHEAGPTRWRPSCRSGDLAGDQSLEFLQLLEQES